MYVEILKAGAASYEKLFEQYQNIEDTNNIDWDDTTNGMNDYYETVTSCNAVVTLFSKTNYEGDSITVPSGVYKVNLKDNGFDHKVGSIQITQV